MLITLMALLARGNYLPVLGNDLVGGRLAWALAHGASEL